MITAGEFQNGKTIRFDSGIWTVTESQLVESPKGSSFVRARLKNIVTGNSIEKSFRPDESFEEAVITCRSMQYLFRKGDFYSFMDTESYKQVDIPAELVGDALKYVKENEICHISSHQGSIFSIEGPMFVELKVTETEEPEEQPEGAIAAGGTKTAVVETGATVLVPLSVQKGDKIRIAAKNGEYLSRV